MKYYFTRLCNAGRMLLNSGFFSVFGSDVICKIVTFLGGIIIVRVLSKNDYGAYTYIMNCYGMLCLLNDLGCNSAAAQFCSEQHANPEKRDGFFWYGSKRGLQFSLITSVLIFLSPWFYPFQSREAALLSRLLCFVPILSVVNAFLRTNLQVSLLYSRFAKINFLSTLTHYLAIIPLSLWFGIYGAVFSNYVIQILTLFYSIYISRGYIPQYQKTIFLTKAEKKDFLKLAFATQLNSGIQTGLMLMDILLIGIFIGGNEQISSYKVATTIPSALAFIPAAVMTFVIPHFSRNNNNIAWVRRNYYKLILGFFAVNLLITVVAVAVAPWLIPLVFGKQYTDAVPCYVILMVGYFFSATFSISTTIIYTQKKVRVNLIITALSCSANCILDVILILHFGSIGAAWATTLVHIIRSALSFGYMFIYLRKNDGGTIAQASP